MRNPGEGGISHSPQGSTRREFLRNFSKGALGAGVVLMVGGVGDLLTFTNPLVTKEEEEALRRYPLNPRSQLAEANQEVVVFEQRVRELVGKGRFNDVLKLSDPTRLKSAYQILEEAAGRDRERQAFREKGEGRKRLFGDFLSVVIGGLMAVLSLPSAISQKVERFTPNPIRTS